MPIGIETATFIKLLIKADFSSEATICMSVLEFCLGPLICYHWACVMKKQTIMQTQHTVLARLLHLFDIISSMTTNIKVKIRRAPTLLLIKVHTYLKYSVPCSKHMYKNSGEIFRRRCNIPANTGHCPCVGSMLGNRLRRWPNIEPTHGQCPVFAGIQSQARQQFCNAEADSSKN